MMIERNADAPAWPANLPPMPSVDFSLFGEVETVPLPRHQRLVASFLARNWAQIPHVTHHDEALVPSLDEVRQALSARIGIKLTPVPFIIKAVIRALQAFPRFNASLTPDGERLVMKRYFHIGVAVETPNGLVVPVIRDCDKKAISEIATELADKATRARTKGLPIVEMTGGCFSVSSLGHLGGTAFTPIINAPEVAILGITRSVQRPMLVDGELRSVPVLPLSLSYDHRVINGADAARFTRFVADALTSPADLI